MEHTFFYDSTKVTVTGVTSLDSFEEKEAVIGLENSILRIKGTGFVLSDMAQETKKLIFLGKVSSTEYSSKNEKSSVLKRLFK